MPNFPDDVLNAFRKQLEAEKKKGSAHIKELTKQDPFTDPDRTNDNAASDAEASEESGHDRVSALIDELKNQQREIDAALGRINDGTYGVCTHCHKLIDPERLHVLPAATLCLDCETKK